MYINRSFDTETVNGEVVVVAFGDGSYILYPTLEDFLKKLSTGSGGGRFFSWNIRFDCDVFLKKLPMDNILELLEEDSSGTTFKNWKIKYFSNSSLIVKDLTKGKTTKVWDLARFYNYLKLSSAAESYLPTGEQKMTSDVINNFVGKQNTIQYFEENQNEIVKYCKQDARATRLLADVFEQTCERDNYDFRNPYSIGNLGIKFFRQYLTYQEKGRNYNIPRIHPCHFKYSNTRLRLVEAVQEILARGGWNDCFKRGKFTEVWDADIVSAYPYFMQLAPYWDGEWIETFNESELEEYTYGYVSCEFRNLNIPMLPSVYQYFNESEIFGEKTKWTNNSVIWATLNEKWVRIMLPLPMYKYLRNYADTKFRVATYLKPTEEFKDFYPLKEPVSILYERKKASKKGSVEYNLAKTVMNGTSGKFKQRLHTDNTWFFYPQLYGYITWRVKEMVLDLIIKNNLWDELISVSTDGAVFSSKPKNISVSKELGGWELERFSPFVQVGNGIYYGIKEDNEPIFRLRGFHMGKASGKLQELIESEPTKSVIKLETYRPLHLRECVKHHKVLKVSDVGRFVKIKKRLNINKEIKRDWQGERFQDIRDMLSGRILESKAWDYSVAVEMSIRARKKIEKEMKEE